MKKLMTVAVSALCAVVLLGVNAEDIHIIHSIKAGDFSTGGTWSAGENPDLDDTYVILHKVVYKENASSPIRSNDITVGAGGELTFNGNRTPSYSGRITVEDGGVLKSEMSLDAANLTAFINFREGFVLRVRDGGKFWTNHHIGQGAELTLTSDCVLSDGELWLGHPDVRNNTASGRGYRETLPLRFKGRAVVRGTQIHAFYLTPMTADSVLDLAAGQLVLSVADNDGLWSANGAYLNFTPYSTLELVLPGSAVSAFATFFSGEQARVRYAGEPVAEGDFAALFDVTDVEDGMVSIRLKPQTSDTILVEGAAEPTRVFDGQSLKALQFFRVVYPSSGATVVYSTDDGATWQEDQPVLRDAGSYTIKVRVSAAGLDDLVCEYGQVVEVRDASQFTAKFEDQNYTGFALEPDSLIVDPNTFAGQLVRGRDYDIAYKDNVNVGIATCKISFKGDYSGESDGSFKVLPPARSGDIYVDPSSAGGDGSEDHPFKGLGDACKSALSDSTIHLAPGTYELSEQIRFAQVRNIALVGAGSATTKVVPAEGVLARHMFLQNVTNFSACGISFCQARQEAVVGDSLSVYGGSFYIAGSQNVRFEDCVFADNRAQNTTSVSFPTATTPRGGAVYALDSDLHFNDCRFEENGTEFSKVVTGTVNYGGTLFVSAPTGASDSSLRINVTATNCIFRSGFHKIATSGTPPLSYGVAICLNSAGGDFYNCLITGMYSLGDRNVHHVIHADGTGVFHRYTQCTIADNAAATCFSGHAKSGSSPILIRSIVSGHYRDIDNSSSDPQAVLIDSVYSSGAAPKASVKICGTTYSSSNYAICDADTVLSREGEAAAGSEAALRNAGWRPDGGSACRDWYVAASATAADTNEGTEGSPFRTLSKAISVCGNGDTIHLADGTYAQSAGESLPWDLTGKCGITIIGAGRDATILDGEGDSSGKTAFVFDRTHGFRMFDLTLTRFDPKATAAGTPSIFVMKGSGHPVFRNVAFNENRHVVGKNVSVDGLMTISYSGLVAFHGCQICDNVMKQANYGSLTPCWGVKATWSYLDFVQSEIRGNGFEKPNVGNANNGSTALMIDVTGINTTYSSGLNVRNCLFADNGQRDGTDAFTKPLIHVNTTDPVTFENCTFANNADGTLVSLERTDYKTSVIRNCVVSHPKTVLALVNGTFSTKTTVYSRTAAEDASFEKFSNFATFGSDGVKLGEDPKFRDAANGDYHLTDESTCAIDKGDKTLGWMSEASTDLDGNPRMVGYLKRKELIPDLGCYELPRKVKGLMLLVR